MQDDDETDEHDVERADEDMVDDRADVDVELCDSFTSFPHKLYCLRRIH